MAWTTPKTDWATGELVAAGDLNAIGNNLVELKSPPTAHYELDEASDYTTTSTSFVDVDATNLALTITTTGGDVLVGFHGSLSQGGTSAHLYLDVELDGARIGGDDGIVGFQAPDTTQGDREVVAAFVRLITGLDAGSHTFKLQWKVSGNTGTMLAGAGTANWDVHPQFWAREVS